MACYKLLVGVFEDLVLRRYRVAVVDASALSQLPLFEGHGARSVVGDHTVLDGLEREKSETILVSGGSGVPASSRLPTLAMKSPSKDGANRGTHRRAARDRLGASP